MNTLMNSTLHLSMFRRMIQHWWWLLCLPWCSIAATEPMVEKKPGSGQQIAAMQPGEYLRKVANHRKYLLYVPRSVNAGATISGNLPLVLFFHGGGGHMEQAAKAYGWRETAEREGFVLAIPNGSSIFPRGHLATWNAGHCCGYARDKKVMTSLL